MQMGLTIPKHFHVRDMEGLTFPTVEHAFQASKLIFSDVAITSVDIMELSALHNNKLTPQQAKTRGGRKHFNSIGITLDIGKWNSIAIDVMKDLVVARYATDERFKDIIMNAKKKQMKFKHFERSGAKSLWGGFFKEGMWLGQNQLGKIMDDCQ
jgi:predicted NAD-dependent protein-ADP-ribosyltransferase YbiA (DUF1768 family)